MGLLALLAGQRPVLLLLSHRYRSGAASAACAALRPARSCGAAAAVHEVDHAGDLCRGQQHGPLSSVMVITWSYTACCAALRWTV